MQLLVIKLTKGCLQNGSFPRLRDDDMSLVSNASTTSRVGLPLDVQFEMVYLRGYDCMMIVFSCRMKTSLLKNNLSTLTPVSNNAQDTKIMSAERDISRKQDQRKRRETGEEDED